VIKRSRVEPRAYVRDARAFVLLSLIELLLPRWLRVITFLIILTTRRFSRAKSLRKGEFGIPAPYVFVRWLGWGLIAKSAQKCVIYELELLESPTIYAAA
jgi:hypothetical protein